MDTKNIESKFKLFADKIISEIDREQLLVYTKNAYKEFGRGTVLMYPTIFTEYDLNKIEESKINTSYLSLAMIKNLPNNTPAIIAQIKSYDPNSELVLTILPYDEEEPTDNDVNHIYSIVI